MAEPRDGFVTYFAEKLWETVPPVYRDEDGRAENPGVLRALVEIMAQQAAVLRRSHDRLWDDQFVDLADDWVIPYLADLIGTRLVSALNPRGRRVDVAKTIYYRRRKGTLAVLEQLIDDIAEWDGTVVEEFRRLARARHGLDPEPAMSAGRFSGTLPGGWADLRSPRVEELTGGPFDEFHYTADFRRHRGIDGRHNIPRLSFHLFRLTAFEVRGVQPHSGPDPLTFTVDPSGRDVPLFMPRSRPDGWTEWRRAREWELPSPVRCRVLGHAEYEIGEGLILDLIANQALPAAAAAELRTIRGRRFASEPRLDDALDQLPNTAAWRTAARFRAVLAGAIVEDCGKRNLYPDAVSVSEGANQVVRERAVAGDLGNWTVAAVGKRLVIDPERGRLRFLGVAPGSGVSVTYQYGFSGPVGAGTFDRREVEGAVVTIAHQGGGQIGANGLDPNGVAEIQDSSTYAIGVLADRNDVQDMIFQADNQERPFIRLTSAWTLDTFAGANATLILDGLWIGSDGGTELILRGDYKTATVRHCSLDPGGIDFAGGVIPGVRLIVEGHVERLVVEASITGPIRARAGGVVETLEIHDSIVQSRQTGLEALRLMVGEVDMASTTVFGAADLHRLSATDSLFTGAVDVTDTQSGCFRFSAAPEGSRLPRPYRSFLVTESEHFFTSRLFGNPGYAQLSETAPEELLRGAENGSEMGVFSWLHGPIKLEGLHAKVDEYMPFGLIPTFVLET